MKDIKIDISSVGFPSQFVSDAEKATEEFGLQIGQAIQYEWFKKDGNQCRYYNQWRDFYRLRLYARGEQPVGGVGAVAEAGAVPKGEPSRHFVEEFIDGQTA